MPSFFDFLSDVIANPTLLITVFLTLGVIFQNGWTDAPNAIATCVSTRAIPPKPAIVMAAVFWRVRNDTVNRELRRPLQHGGLRRKPG